METVRGPARELTKELSNRPTSRPGQGIPCNQYSLISPEA